MKKMWKKVGLFVILAWVCVGLSVGLTGCNNSSESQKPPLSSEGSDKTSAPEIAPSNPSQQPQQPRASKPKSPKNKPSSPSKKEDNKSEIVYITKYGKKYHKRGCRHIKNSEEVFEITESEALRLGYEPCSTCFDVR